MILRSCNLQTPCDLESDFGKTMTSLRRPDALSYHIAMLMLQRVQRNKDAETLYKEVIRDRLCPPWILGTGQTGEDLLLTCHLSSAFFGMCNSFILQVVGWVSTTCRNLLSFDFRFEKPPFYYTSKTS